MFILNQLELSTFSTIVSDNRTSAMNKSKPQPKNGNINKKNQRLVQ